MTKNTIAYQTAKILLDTKSVLINTKEPFTYTSGKKGPVYVDMRRMISFPKERSILMDFAADVTKDIKADYIAGGEAAGIPYAAFIAERLDAPMLYVRKKPKGQGRMSQIEGCMEKENAKILLVEDLQNRGTSQRIFIDAMREAGANVDDVFVVFAYNLYNEERDTTLHFLTDWTSIVEVVKAENLFSNEEITSLEAFLDNPDAWEQAA